MLADESIIVVAGHHAQRHSHHYVDGAAASRACPAVMRHKAEWRNACLHVPSTTSGVPEHAIAYGKHYGVASRQDLWDRSLDCASSVRAQ